MNVNSLSGLLGNAAATGVGSVGTGQTSRQSSVPPPPKGGAGSASISTPAQFFSEMQQLSQSNPTEFKAVAAQASTAFQDAASKASGPDAQALTKLANQFSQAAQTGTLSSPQATQGSSLAGGTSAAHHHRHRHGHGAGGAAVQQAFQSVTGILDQTQGSTTTTGSASGAK